MFPTSRRCPSRRARRAPIAARSLDSHPARPIRRPGRGRAHRWGQRDAASYQREGSGSEWSSPVAGGRGNGNGPRDRSSARTRPADPRNRSSGGKATTQAHRLRSRAGRPRDRARRPLRSSRRLMRAQLRSERGAAGKESGTPRSRRQCRQSASRREIATPPRAVRRRRGAPALSGKRHPPR